MWPHVSKCAVVSKQHRQSSNSKSWRKQAARRRGKLDCVIICCVLEWAQPTIRRLDCLQHRSCCLYRRCFGGRMLRLCAEPFLVGWCISPGEGGMEGNQLALHKVYSASELTYMTPEHSVELSAADFIYGFECSEAVGDWLTKVLACEHAWQRADEAAEQQTKVDHRKGTENRKGKKQSMWEWHETSQRLFVGRWYRVDCNHPPEAKKFLYVFTVGQGGCGRQRYGSIQWTAVKVCLPVSCPELHSQAENVAAYREALPIHCCLFCALRLTIHVCLAKAENPRAASCPPRGASYRENVEAYRENKLQRLGFYISHLNEPGDSISW